MSVLLKWKDGVKNDVQFLNHLVVTDYVLPRGFRAKDWPPPDSSGPWWEWEIQQEVKNLRLPMRGLRSARVGHDAAGVGAVSVCLELDGPAEVRWELGAIATRLRGRGGGYADELATDLFDELTARAVAEDVPIVNISALVFEMNGASQAMCRRHGFRHISMAANRVQLWERELLVGI